MFVGPVGAAHMRHVRQGSDPFTGLWKRERDVDMGRPPASTDQRREILRHVLLDGAAWEPDSGEMLDHFCNAVTKPVAKKGPKRLGANRVKYLE